MNQLKMTVCVLATITSLWVTDTTSAQANNADIFYESPAAALRALHARADVTFAAESGWTIAVDRTHETVWSFVPDGHPAYPAVIKRQVVEVPGGLGIRTTILCGGPQAACDNLPADFKKSDDLLRRHLFPQPNQ